MEFGQQALLRLERAEFARPVRRRIFAMLDHTTESQTAAYIRRKKARRVQAVK